MIEKHNLVLIALLILFIILFGYYVTYENDISNANTTYNNGEGQIWILNEDTNIIELKEVNEYHYEGEASS